jgi:hypothetical protein
MPISTIGTAGLEAAGVSQAKLATGVAGTGPAFSAYQSTAQTALAAGTNTKLLFQTEEFDTNSNFNNTASTVGSTPAYAFLPTVAGYYQVNANFVANTNYAYGNISVYKNGILAKFGNSSGQGYNSSNAWTISVLIYMNGTTDYLEIYGLTSVSQTPAAASTYTYFQAFLARSA